MFGKSAVRKFDYRIKMKRPFETDKTGAMSTEIQRHSLFTSDDESMLLWNWVLSRSSFVEADQWSL